MAVTLVDTDGGTLAVEVDGEGPLVVCSPGIGDTRDAYGPVAEQLVAAGYRVARVDLRGHGDSSAHFNRYGDEATADDYLTVVENLGGGPAVLAGASLSAASATIAAGRRPDLVAGIVLLGPFLRNGAGAVLRAIMGVAIRRPLGPYIWQSYAAKMWPGLGDGAAARAARSAKLLARPGRWDPFRASFTSDHGVVEPWLARVKAPVLVVIGDADPDWSDPVAEAKWVASNFADAGLLTVHEAGHAPMLERPGEVGPALLLFLEKAYSGAIV